MKINIGSTLVTIMVKDDVATVRAYVKAGVTAAEIGKLAAYISVSRP